MDRVAKTKDKRERMAENKEDKWNSKDSRQTAESAGTYLLKLLLPFSLILEVTGDDYGEQVCRCYQRTKVRLTKHYDRNKRGALISLSTLFLFIPSVLLYKVIGTCLASLIYSSLFREEGRGLSRALYGSYFDSPEHCL